MTTDNPQLNDGYTQIAHTIVENVARADLSGAQFRVLLMLWRQTYGNRGAKSVTASFAQWSSWTGMPRRCIIRVLNGLERKNIITVKRYARRPSIYGFQKRPKEWRIDMTEDAIASDTQDTRASDIDDTTSDLADTRGSDSDDTTLLVTCSRSVSGDQRVTSTYSIDKERKKGRGRNCVPPARTRNPTLDSLINTFQNLDIEKLTMRWLERACEEFPQYANPDMVKRCVAYFRATGKKRTDWGATFYNWCSNESVYEKRRGVPDERQAETTRMHANRYVTAADLEGSKEEPASEDQRREVMARIREMSDAKSLGRTKKEQPR